MPQVKPLQTVRPTAIIRRDLELVEQQIQQTLTDIGKSEEHTRELRATLRRLKSGRAGDGSAQDRLSRELRQAKAEQKGE